MEELHIRVADPKIQEMEALILKCYPQAVFTVGWWIYRLSRAYPST